MAGGSCRVGLVSRQSEASAFALRAPSPLGSLGDVGLGSVGVSAESNIPLPYMLLHTVCIHGTQGQVRDTTAYTMVHRELRGLHIAVPVAVLIATAI